MENETKSPEVETLQPEAEVKTAVPSAAPVAEETQEQINWRKFREAREKDRKEKLAAEKRAADKEAEVAALKAAMEAIVNKPESNDRQTNQFTEETDDQRIKRLIAQTIEEQRQKDQIERDRKEQQEFPQKLTQNFKDFDRVCTAENLDYLEYHYPEVAAPFRKLPDSYEKWADVYNAVKRFVPNLDSKKEQAKAEKNFLKPQAMSIAGKTPTGDSAPQMLDDKRKADNWARMQRNMRGGA